MTPSKRLLTIVLTLALGFGVWTLAVTFQTADFASGDVLSASELNTLLNDNFDEAANAIDGKLDTTGGTITGRTDIEAEAESGDLESTVFHVENTADDGTAAIFRSNNGSNLGAVSIKQEGGGPALSIKALGGGPLLTGADSGVVRFLVENDGTIKIGNLGDGTDAPNLTLDASDGTITNAVGSGLPLAFGYVTTDGTKQSGTDNFSVARDGEDFRITIDGVSYQREGFATVAQGVSPDRYHTRVGANGGDLIVSTIDHDETKDAGAFYFVTYQDGN
jgi:hypothetical protein